MRMLNEGKHRETGGRQKTKIMKVSEFVAILVGLSTRQKRNIVDRFKAETPPEAVLEVPSASLASMKTPVE
jgi:hypothetical protein